MNTLMQNIYINNSTIWNTVTEVLHASTHCRLPTGRLHRAVYEHLMDTGRGMRSAIFLMQHYIVPPTSMEP